VQGLSLAGLVLGVDWSQTLHEGLLLGDGSCEGYRMVERLELDYQGSCGGPRVPSPSRATSHCGRRTRAREAGPIPAGCSTPPRWASSLYSSRSCCKCQLGS
jgi:hypothetical protein